MTKPPSPRGVVAIVTDETGRVVAHAADFSMDRPGGFSALKAQECRAKTNVVRLTIRAYSSPRLWQAMSDYLAEETFNALLRDHGFGLTLIPIGHEVDK